MKNKAIKSLEQMLALDDSKGDIFEQSPSNTGKETNQKGNQMLKKFSGRIQASMSDEKDKKAEERARKFEKMAEKAQDKMLQNSKT